MLDTKGPETGWKRLKWQGQLKKGQTFTLVTQSVVGNAERASITYPDLPRDIREGTTILIDDGLVEMTVRSLTAGEIVCIVNNDGMISDRKSVNVPDVDLSMPYLSPKDREDIAFGVKNGVDFIAASFTRTAEDILDVRKLFSALGRTNVSIIAKIENMQGVQNIDEILRVSEWHHGGPRQTWAWKSRWRRYPSSRRCSFIRRIPPASRSSPPRRCLTA